MKQCFLWYDKNMKLEGTLVSHVDDFVYSGTDGWRIRVMDTIMDKFKISEHSKGSFKYIGLNVVQTSTSVYVDQQKYIDGLKEITLSAERMKQKDAQLLPEEKVGTQISQWSTFCGRQHRQGRIYLLMLV